MKETEKVPESLICEILTRYGLDAAFSEQMEYIHYTGENGEPLVKVILSVRLSGGQRVVIKILHEEGDLLKDRAKIEKQSAFSERMRQCGIRTPMRYAVNGQFCAECIAYGLPCNVTVEDWCGEEIRAINVDRAYRIGVLMAQMHTLSLEHHCAIGCGTLFSAAGWNDVDAFSSFCKITHHEQLDQTIVEQIKHLHDEKLTAIRAVWERLPKAAVQGDISINNLVDGEEGLRVFDYNNAGDEVLISDLVMEGLLTAYEMELPDGAEERLRESLFPALLDGYLSVRKLSREEADAAWTVYTLYHGLWFTRIVYQETSLEKRVERGEFDAANRLLAQMLADLTERNDGRFER